MADCVADNFMGFYRMRQIYADYLVGVESANAKNDLKWWDSQRGVDMQMNWPQFEVIFQISMQT